MLFDCDSHFYETRDAFTRHLPKKYLDRTVSPVVVNGNEVILVGDKVAVFQSELNTYEVAYRPGSLREMLRQMASGNPDETYQPEPMRPEYQDRDERLAVMDAQGVTRALSFPGAPALALENLMNDTEALYANAHSFNLWLDETWSFNFKDRIYVPAVLSLRDLDLAVQELDFVLGRGARFIMLPSGPAYGRSPGDPYFDPFWARLNEANATLAVHVIDFWYNPHIAPAWGHNPYPASWHMSAWQWQHTFGERPIQEMLSALIFDNIFGRYPNVHAVASEFGASWVPHFVYKMDVSRGLGRNGPWIGGKLPERPSEIFRRHVRVAPYPEEDTPKIVADIGNADSIVLGSDWPHAEGYADPAHFVPTIASLPESDQQKILWDNAMDLVA
jgi:predicted TIM-barrel fold metal-dependent hydrolase